jgi:hypothetical protein
VIALVFVLPSTFAALSQGAVASSAPVSQSRPAGTYKTFTDPQMVKILGYSGRAMEPFISEDGEHLLFNTSNVAPSIPALEFATRVEADTFQYQGEIEGANQSGYLSGTPSMDNEGEPVLRFHP